MSKRIPVLFCLFCLFLGSIRLFGQSWEQVKAQKDLFLWGEGWGSTLDEADQNALADLISQISVMVSHLDEGQHLLAIDPDQHGTSGA